MMKSTLSLAALALLAATNAQAITYGQADGNKHPQVGALVDYDSKGTAYAFCTGTMISPTVMLTAAHCNPGVSAVKVTFDSKVLNSAVMYVGQYHPHPEYRQQQNDPHDIAVIVFDQPIPAVAPARLPTLGLFDTLKNNGLLANTSYTAVGFGGQERSFDGKGGWTIAYQDSREWSVSAFGALNDSWLRLSQNNATGNGGTCYGDSGGPNFFGSGSGETRMIAGTTITGDTPCVQSNVIYRLDTQSARAFLAGFVALP
ncbi:trypsin-like serine protease [Duganella sp. Root1480D1]|uniref:S1 family peptidase n=1 Tax=Duganella sp. Root1480D1 TaxID=1736471 RepID=UPI00070E1D8A|nr:trypsin-like serine protease [Duganella sp. Root1480D1]KQZ39644.1 peptidase S1 [Duganella sp. Root1480D1]